MYCVNLGHVGTNQRLDNYSMWQHVSNSGELRFTQVNYNLPAVWCQQRKGKRLERPLKLLSGLEFGLNAEECVPRYNLQERDSPSQNIHGVKKFFMNLFQHFDLTMQTKSLYPLCV